MLDFLQNFGIELIKTVLVPVTAIGLTYASTKIPGWIAAHVKNTRAQGILNRLDVFVTNTVQEVEQTFVSNLKDNNPESLKTARDQALATVKSHLGVQGLKDIENILGLDGQNSVERLIISFIESAVFALTPHATK